MNYATHNWLSISGIGYSGAPTGSIDIDANLLAMFLSSYPLAAAFSLGAIFAFAI